MVAPAAIITIIVIIVVVLLVGGLLLYFLVLRKRNTTPASTECTVAPAKPSNFKIIDATQKSIMLVWDGQSDAESYTVISGNSQNEVLTSGSIVYSDKASAGTKTAVTIETQKTLYFVLEADNLCGTTTSDVISYSFCSITPPEPFDNTSWFAVTGHTNNSSGTTFTFNISGIPEEQFPLTLSFSDIEFYSTDNTDCIQHTGSGSGQIQKGNTFNFLIPHGDTLDPTNTADCPASAEAAIDKCSQSTLMGTRWIATMKNVKITNQCSMASIVLDDYTLNPICP